MLLHDGITGQLIAVLNASPITEIRTAAVSAVATKLLARPGSRTVAVLGSGVQGRSHVDAMQTVLDDPIIRIWSRNPAARRGARARDALARGGVRRGGARRRRRRLHDDRRQRADRRAGLAGAGSSHQRGRSLPERQGARAQLRDRRRGAALRRPARVDAQRVGRLPGRGRGAGARPRPHRRRSWASS